MRCAGLDPVDLEVALREQPGTVDLDEHVAVSKGGEHQFSLVARANSIGLRKLSYSGGGMKRVPATEVLAWAVWDLAGQRWICERIW
jgi:hypothetical protein